jgi:hypothetical protein
MVGAIGELRGWGSATVLHLGTLPSNPEDGRVSVLPGFFAHAVRTWHLR